MASEYDERHAGVSTGPLPAHGTTILPPRTHAIVDSDGLIGALAPDKQEPLAVNVHRDHLGARDRLRDRHGQVPETDTGRGASGDRTPR
jgi:hypothetical protein